jgi:sulfur carrier protein
MIQITLNGKPRDIPRETDVPGLLAELNVKPEQVAVAINSEVVRRLDWPQTTVREGDIVEVVRAVGGGSANVPRSIVPSSSR